MNEIKNLEGEVWKQIPDFPDYQASNMGRVKSTKCNRTKLMSLSNRRGYRVTTLYDKQHPKVMAIHTLVLLTFVGPPPQGKKSAKHLNGDKADNHLENLKWASHKECFNGKPKGPKWKDIPAEKRKPHPSSKLTKEDVLYIRNSDDTRQSLADKFNVGIKTIFVIRAGKSWKWLK